MLAGALPEGVMKMEHSVESFEPINNGLGVKLTVTVGRGESATTEFFEADMVVGADGINSTLRSIVAPQDQKRYADLMSNHSAACNLTWIFWRPIPTKSVYFRQFDPLSCVSKLKCLHLSILSPQVCAHACILQLNLLYCFVLPFSCLLGLYQSATYFSKGT